MEQRILSWIDRHASGDETITAALRANGLASFPHTTLDYSGEMTTRVVTSLYASGVERVVALGVIHVGALSERYQQRFSELLDPHVASAVRKEHLKTFGGAFIRSHEETAFGDIETITPINSWHAIRTDDSLLEGEFCLDYFLSILRLAADRLGREPLAVIPIYSGASFDPTSGSFALATEVASEIAKLDDGKTAFVITGDLVHYGTNYSKPEEMHGKPTTIAGLKQYFLPLVEQSLHEITKTKNYQAAFDLLNKTLHNDQRFLLPVVGELLRGDASFEIIEFHLSDYAPIWQVDPPCAVASSVVTFTPGHARS
ncbi:MAG: hypothetical protein GWP12_02755 [Nitrospirae bacterium]|nr:hypothetical protein [Nitrospirota bacterium]